MAARVERRIVGEWGKPRTTIHTAKSRSRQFMRFGGKTRFFSLPIVKTLY